MTLTQVAEPDSTISPIRRRRLVAFVVAIPDRFLIIFMCAVLATTITVQLSIFHPYTLFPLFVVLVVASWKLAPTPFGGPQPPGPATGSSDGAGQAAASRAAAFRGLLGDRRWQWIGAVAVVVLAIAWFLVQRPYYSELISVRRDPSIYTLRGFWLMDHPSPDVLLTQQLLDIKKAVPSIGLDFGAETRQLIRHFQSTSVVPGMIAVAGWIGGASLLFQANLMIGAAALICTYAVGRRMAGPVLGLLPVAALGLSMPLTAFSRVAYTEPVALISLLTCLLGLWEAARTGRKAMWLLAGLGAGAACIARIDGWIVVIGGLVAIGIWGAATTSAAMRRKVLIGLVLYCVGAAVTGTLGYTDLKFHSPDYLFATAASFHPLMEGVFATGVIAFLVILIPGMGWVARWVRAHSVVIGRVVVALVAVTMLVMIARPLFYQANFTTSRIYMIGIGNRQKAEGLPIDPTRSYDEHSINWIAWYLGWPAVILACLAGLYAIRAAFRDRFAPIVLVTAVIAVSAALYLNVVSISADQIWAMRRFLPVVLPGGLLLIAWGLNELYERRAAVGTFLARRVPGLPQLARPKVIVIVVGVLTAVVALFPAFTWGPMYPVREGAGQYDMVQKVCPKIANQKVLLIGTIPVMGFYQPTFRNLCGSTVITIPNSDAKKLGAAGARAEQQGRIAQVMKLWGVNTVKVVTFYVQPSTPWTRPPGAPFVADTYQMWESVLSHRPQSPRTETTQIWLGTAAADGSVVPGIAG